MKIAEITFGLLLFIISLFMFITGLSYSYQSESGPGPGFFPVWINGLMMITTLVFVISITRKDISGKFFANAKGFKNLFIYIVLFIIAILMIEVLGMMVSLALFCFIIFKYMEKYSWKNSILVSLTTMIIIFLIFELWLNMGTPSGLFFS